MMKNHKTLVFITTKKKKKSLRIETNNLIIYIGNLPITQKVLKHFEISAMSNWKSTSSSSRRHIRPDSQNGIYNINSLISIKNNE